MQFTVPRNSKTNDINYLLELLEKTDEELAKDTDVYKFIQDFELKGDYKFFPNSVIYYIYCKQKKYNKMSRVHFFRAFKHFFRSASKNGERGYFLSNRFKPTKEDYENGRNLTRKDTYGKKNKKK